MRAVVVKDGGGPSSAMSIGEIEKPTPEQGQVLVKVSIASRPSASQG